MRSEKASLKEPLCFALKAILALALALVVLLLSRSACYTELHRYTVDSLTFARRHRVHVKLLLKARLG